MIPELNVIVDFHVVNNRHLNCGVYLAGFRLTCNYDQVQLSALTLESCQ